MLSKPAKKWLTRLIVIALLVSGIGYYAFGRDKQITYVTEIVQNRDVREIVDVTGSVEASEVLALRFPSGGKIESMLVAVGDKVTAGQKLAQIDATFAAIDVQKAQASVAAAEAEYNLLYQGPPVTEEALYKTDIDDAELALAHAAESLLNTKKINEHKLVKAEQDVLNSTNTVQNAEIALENSKKSGGTSEEKADKTLTDVFANAENRIRSALDSIEQTLSVADRILDDKSSEGREYQAFLGFKDPQSKITAKNSFKLQRSLLASLKSDFETAQSEWSAELVTTMLQKTETVLLGSKTLSDDIFAMLEASTESASLPASKIKGFQTEITSERSTLLAKIDTLRSTTQTIADADLSIASTGVSSTSAVDSAEAALSDAQNRLILAEQALDELKTQNSIALNDVKKDIELKKLRVRRTDESLAKLVAKPRPVDTAAAQARLQQAMANLRQAQEQYDDMFLISPVDGVVTEVNGKVGENATVTEPTVSLMTDGLQITANISETDVAKIAIGDPVEISLDALPRNVVFDGTVTKIDPAETVIQGVIYYQATVVFDGEDERIKSGMTADLEILVNESPDALSVTPGAIQYEEDTPFVYVLENDEKVRRDITVGLEGNDAVEILTGVSVDERIVLYEDEK